MTERPRRISTHRFVVLLCALLVAAAAVGAITGFTNDSGSRPGLRPHQRAFVGSRIVISTLAGTPLGHCAVTGHPAGHLVCTRESPSSLGVYDTNGRYLGSCKLFGKPRPHDKLACKQEPSLGALS